LIRDWQRGGQRAGKQGISDRNFVIGATAGLIEIIDAQRPFSALVGIQPTGNGRQQGTEMQRPRRRRRESTAAGIIQR